jgi:hypothetical protein
VLVDGEDDEGGHDDEDDDDDEDVMVMVDVDDALRQTPRHEGGGPPFRCAFRRGALARFLAPCTAWPPPSKTPERPSCAAVNVVAILSCRSSCMRSALTALIDTDPSHGPSMCRSQPSTYKQIHGAMYGTEAGPLIGWGVRRK